MDELKNLPVTFRVELLAKVLDVNLTRAYEIAKRPGFPSIRLGKRLVIVRDGFIRWLENEIQKDKSVA